jgi:hypothetical protein
MAKKFPRTSMMHAQGSDPADVVQGRVININLVRWTVDIYTTFDRKRYLDVPVGSPYLHYANGEGFSAFPEVGALCYLCTPGDSSGPFVLCFTMPHETFDSSAPDAPQGTRSRGVPTGSSDATFAGNRPKAKPGDIGLRGRDGNFVTLHRGGVLAIGATELSQRIYVPLGNLITDIAENYQMFTGGGTISWGIQDGASSSKFPSQYLHTFRIFANDKYADVKLAMGRVYNPTRDDQTNTGNTDDNPTVLEFTVKPQGFDGVTGDLSDKGEETKLTFLVDKEGNMFLHTKGGVKLKSEKKFELVFDTGFDLLSPKPIGIHSEESVEIVGETSVHVKGKVVRLGPGKRPAASQGDLTTSFITAMPCVLIPDLSSAGPLVPGKPVIGVFSIAPPTLLPPMGIPGSITSGEPTVLIGG